MPFIIANGNSNDASIYDTGVLPLSTEDVYSNGFTVQINANLTVNRLRNDASDYYLPNTAIPIMTSATSPSGIVTVSSQVTGTEGWRAFDRNTSTLWQTTSGVTTGTLAYQFPISKIIKRYSFRNSGAGTGSRNFTFEGSNDGSSWTTLDTQTSINVGANGIFTSGLLANTTAYLYYRINVTTVNGGTTIQMAEFEMTESTSTVVGQTTGGGFVISSINLTVTTVDLTPVATGLISITASSGTTRLNIASSVTAIAVTGASIINNTGNNNLIITCPSLFGVVTSSAGISNSVVLSKSGNGTLTINGAVTGGASNGGAGLHAVSISGSGDTTITGDVNARATGNTNACYGVSHTGSGKLIVFNVNGAGTTSIGYAILSTSTGNLEITGNVTGGGVAAAINKSTGAIIMTGNCTATTLPAIIGTPTSIILVGNALGAVSPSIQITGTGVIDVTGNITASSTAVGIQSTGLVKLSGNAVNTNRYMAIYAPQVTIDTTTTYWKFQQFAGADITLYASGASLGNPVPADVRFGTAYGPSGTLTGTLRVPNPNTVLLGNLTDNTTGTLLMTPADFVSELNTSAASVAVRLRNCATVATTGDQIASYNI